MLAEVVVAGKQLSTDASKKATRNMGNVICRCLKL